jgi:FkbM family methyltransferase
MKQLFFDIGAHEGKWSMENMRVHPCRQIVAVEASPTTFRRLQAMVSRVPAIVPVHGAVCNHTGPEVDFYQAKTDTLSTLNPYWLTDPRSRFYGVPFFKTKCPTVTIDSLIQQYGVPDLIKIDVEGAEDTVLASLSQPVPLLCFEWAAELDTVYLACLARLEMLGFHRFFLQHKDHYTFRPREWVDLATVKLQLAATVPKKDWGMIWAAAAAAAEE